MNVGFDSCPEEAGLLLHRMLGVFSLSIKRPITSNQGKAKEINQRVYKSSCHVHSLPNGARSLFKYTRHAE